MTTTHNEQYGTKIRGGGVLTDTPKSTVEIGFSGWKKWADESEYGIKTYTSLEQMGLSDTEMSPDDFVENMNKITVANRTPFVAFLQIYNANADKSNFRKSLIKKLTDDGLVVSDTINFQLKIERASVYNTENIKLEVFFDLKQYREKTIIAYANRDGNTMNVYPFRETAYIEKQTTDVELLNGWEVRNYFVIEKIGNLVNVNFIIHKGVRDHGTIIFVLPPEYRPKASISVPTPFTGIATSTISFGFNGNVIIYGWHESTGGYFIVSASYVVD